ncbi:MAG: MFS transporter [Planctomycetota bacterium]
MSTDTLTPPIDLSDKTKHEASALSHAIETDLVASDSPRFGVASRGFLGLLLTQFLGAMNDNLFRWLIVPIGKGMVTEAQTGAVVAMGAAALVLPFVLFAAPAGYLADRFSKRNVIIGCKLLELLVMLVGVAAILSGSVTFMFIVLFAMGTQSALFGPAKYGAIPELVRADRIPAANGLIGMTTILAIIAGTFFGGMLFDQCVARHPDLWWVWAAAVVGIALVGCFASLMVRPLRAAAPDRPFPWNPVGETLLDVKRLYAVRPLFLAAIGSAVFWSMGGLYQLNVDRMASQDLGWSQTHVGVLLGVIALGVGLGNVAAGFLSRRRIELGIVPLAAMGIGISAAALFWVPDVAANGVADPAQLPSGFFLPAALLFALGLFAGAYDVPLASFLQFRSPRASRGAILAAYNMLTFSAMILATGVFWFLADVCGLSGRQVFLVAGLGILPIVVVSLWLIPTQTLALVMRIVMHLTYRVRVEGLENVPQHGPALLVSNHVSWIDGPLMGLLSPREPRILVYAEYFDKWWLGWFGRLARVIPIRPGRRSVIESIRKCREAVDAGEVVGIFPEGGLTRDGRLQPFQQGFMAVIKNREVPVVPVAIEGLWGSIFSFEGGRCFTKWPKGFRRRVTVRFGAPLFHPESAEEVRQAVLELMDSTSDVRGGSDERR